MSFYQDPIVEATRKPHFNKAILVVIGLIIVVGGAAVVAAKQYNFLRSAKRAEPQEQTVTKTGGYQENVDMDIEKVPNYFAMAQKYGVNLSAEQKEYFKKNKFILLDTTQNFFTNNTFNFDEMATAIDKIGGSSNIVYRTPEDTKLINPDIVLHVYHKYFEMTLELLEEKEMTQYLSDFVDGLNVNLSEAIKTNNGATKERYQNLKAQMLVAKILLDNKSPKKPDYFSKPEEETAYVETDKKIDNIDNAKKLLLKNQQDLNPDLAKKVNVELEKIYAAKEIDKSELYGQYSDTQVTDYTQFTPRSHYSKNSTLRAYFRTMMYLGRNSYFLSKDVGVTDASLLAAQIGLPGKNGAPLDYWKKIVTVTDFYVGQSDDLSYNEWQGYLTKIVNNNEQLKLVGNAELINKITSSLNTLRLPKILSDVVIDESIADKTKSDLLRQSLSFRVFGQKFTYDASVLNDLTGGQEKSEVKLPSTPTALFISAIFGDKTAEKYSTDFLQREAGFTPEEADKFLVKLNLKKDEVSKVTKEQWFGSIGSAWLYVLGSLTKTFDSTYPTYMQSLAYLDKQIQTFLGSYAELKHDTLLYAKQSYAELGGGGGDMPIPPVVKGFVEPNIDFWQRFSDLLDRTESLYVNNGLFVNHSALERLKSFKEITAFYKRIAEAELAGTQISDEDYERLRVENLSFMVQPYTPIEADENSGKVALVADVHTDALKNQILYEATARPYLMWTLVGNENSPRLVAGLVYNHYEFTGPLTTRTTDEVWKDQVYNNTDKMPAKNSWYQSLIVH